MVKDATFASGSATPNEVGRTISGTRAAVRPPSAEAHRSPDAKRAPDSSKDTNPMRRHELRALVQRCEEEEKAAKVPALVNVLADADDGDDVHEAKTVFLEAPPAEPDHDFRDVDALLEDAPPSSAIPSQFRVEVLGEGYWTRRIVALALLGGALVVLQADATPVSGATPVARAVAR
jgi:hypothetical protein